MSNFVMISYSVDGGETWSAEIWRKLVGPEKNYLTRVVIPILPSCFSIIFKIRYSGNTSFTLVEAHANVSQGI